MSAIWSLLPIPYGEDFDTFAAAEMRPLLIARLDVAEFNSAVAASD